MGLLRPVFNTNKTLFAETSYIGLLTTTDLKKSQACPIWGPIVPYLGSSLTYLTLIMIGNRDW